MEIAAFYAAHDVRATFWLRRQKENMRLALIGPSLNVSRVAGLGRNNSNTGKNTTDKKSRANMPSLAYIKQHEKEIADKSAARIEVKGGAVTAMTREMAGWMGKETKWHKGGRGRKRDVEERTQKEQILSRK